MIFVDSIYQLQYYNPPPSPIPCYCESVVAPTDLQLQGLIYNGNHSYTIKIYSYSADGKTQYADDTSFFDYFFATTNSGQDYFQIRLKTFSPSMCDHQCYIFRVVVTQDAGATTLFDKYTEKYCQTGCCTPAYDIAGVQTDITTGGGDNVDTAPVAPSYPVNECGERLLKLTSEFSCVDNFTNEIYGEPFDVLSASGDTWGFSKVSYFKGRLVRRPRNIQRDVSYNCNLQRSQSAAPYLLEGYEYFPAWKMTEIEGQLHANYIAVNDYIQAERGLTWDGGNAFDKVKGARDCDEIFKLNVVLRECFIRQIFGCSSACNNSSSQTYIIAAGYQGGNFFTEGQEMIGDYDSLLAYYRSQSGIAAVEDVNVTGNDCGIQYAFTVDGTGYIPTSFYYDAPTQRNRVYGRGDIDLTEYCPSIGTYCTAPQIGAITYSDMTCDAPAIGVITYSDISPENGTITDYAPWVIDTGSTSIINTGGFISFDIKSTRPDGADSGEIVFINNEIIGVVSGNCRPSVSRFIDNTIVTSLPADTNFLIDTNGFIWFTGTIVCFIANEVTVNYTGLFYNT